MTVAVLDLAPPSTLDVGVQRLVGLTEVCIDGSLDERTVAVFWGAIRPLLRTGADVELDCTELVAVDGSGLATLQELRDRLAEQGAAVVVRHAPPALAAALRSAGLGHIVA